MAEFEVRPAKPKDVDALASLWHMIMNERAEMDRRLRLAENAQVLWREQLDNWLQEDHVRVMVADQDGKLIGYIVGWILERPLHHFLQHYGFISDMGVDGHAHQSGIGTALFDAIKPWFQQNSIRHLEVEVMHCHPIAQAFWRSQNVSGFMDRFWYSLEF